MYNQIASLAFLNSGQVSLVLTFQSPMALSNKSVDLHRSEAYLYSREDL